MGIAQRGIYWAGILWLAHACMPVPQHELAVADDVCGCESIVCEAVADGFELGDWPKREWWEEFGDADLSWLIETALSQNPNLKKAEENLKAASQVAIQRRARLFPEIDFTANSNWQHLAQFGFFRAFAPTIPTVVNDVTLGFSYFYEFDFWGKNRDLFKAALGQQAAMLAEKLQAELIVATSIAYTYTELQLLLRKKQLLAKYEANSQSIEAIRGKREKNALDSQAPYLTSQTASLDASAPLIEISAQIEEHRHKLKALSGLGQDGQIEISAQPLNPMAISIPERLHLDLLARRPDLIAQKWRMESAAKEISAAKTDFYPNINISGLIGLESVFWPKLFKIEDYSGSMQPAIHLPIFTAGRIKAQLMEKVASFNEAVYEYNELILRSSQEIADLLTNLYRLQKEIELRKNSLVVAESQEKISLRRFEYAIDDRMALLMAENGTLQAEITLVELQYGLQLASINLIKALGGGFHE